MATDLLLLAAGLALLVGGGSALVRGAGALALRLGVAPILVGLTVVAFGTSTPELVVNVIAAVRGRTEIGFGNVVGSNIANIALLLAVAAMIAPVAVHRTLVIREIPMLIVACIAALALGGLDVQGGPGSGYGRGDGAVLLVLFGVFVHYAIAEALRQRDDSPAGMVPGPRLDHPSGEPGATPGGKLIALLVLGGLAALTVGGELTVRGATGAAGALGIPETVIGLTVVAVGTSLPELATTIAAARRGHGDLVMGTIVGSNLYNLLFVWGLSVVVAPSGLPAGGIVDLLVMTVLSLALLPMAISRHRIGRLEGVLLLTSYAAYMACLAMRAAA